jgi:hypothetical protein
MVPQPCSQTAMMSALNVVDSGGPFEARFERMSA